MIIKTKKLLLGGALSLLTAFTSQADYRTEFETPPFALNTTAIGYDNWVIAGTSSSAPAHAKVVETPWSDTNSLRLWRETSDTTQIRLKKDLNDPREGLVKLSVELAFDFETKTDSGAIQFSLYDLWAGHGPLLFGFTNSSGATGGLFFRGVSTGDTVVILSKSDVSVNSPYTFTFTIDVAAKLFDLSVTGLKADGTDFSFSQTGITSGAFSGNKLKTLYIGNTGNSTLKGYVSSIDVHAIPEPGQTALLLGGGIAVLFYSRACLKRF